VSLLPIGKIMQRLEIREDFESVLKKPESRLVARIQNIPYPVEVVFIIKR
jgi:hypothetical protein